MDIIVAMNGHSGFLNRYSTARERWCRVKTGQGDPDTGREEDLQELVRFSQCLMVEDGWSSGVSAGARRGFGELIREAGAVVDKSRIPRRSLERAAQMAFAESPWSMEDVAKVIAGKVDQVDKGEKKRQSPT